MEKIEILTGTAVPLDVSDVDTDQIIPAVWMKRIERTGYEDGLFEKWRKDPDFVLNDPARRSASILVSGSNFGCGSSREHAPWALRDWGFKAVVAPSFADIFLNNLPNVGLIPVAIDEESCRRILLSVTEQVNATVTINLRSMTVSCPVAGVIDASFTIDEGARSRLLQGKDLIDLALDCDKHITEFEKGRSAWMPCTNGTIEATFEPSGVEA
ncbi:3-isopropylmalate dehydratase small subunit [Ferrimicrobium sp.]|uniref:3-isopropylmalate dehydratase small subunit n=1 Tax=Ferrimicrobium sp. TaxID=2926050 RepID=UPI0026022A0D|nr:3-isopropylmalate dehydratase small subunit [Ferrimicrobium sp.]